MPSQFQAVVMPAVLISRRRLRSRRFLRLHHPNLLVSLPHCRLHRHPQLRHLLLDLPPGLQGQIYKRLQALVSSDPLDVRCFVLS